MPQKPKLYRSKDRVIFGLCQGVADRYDLSVVWIRLGLIATFVLTGFFPVVILYAVASFIIKSETRATVEPNFEEEYYDTSASARTLSLRRLKNKFDAIESRIQRMETYVTDRSYDWERRFRSGQ